MSRTDLPAISQTIRRALELTGCVGVADMAVELVRVRSEVATVTKERDERIEDYVVATETLRQVMGELSAARAEYRNLQEQFFEARAEIAKWAK